MIKVYYWPDGMWYSEEELDATSFQGRSDDYAVIEVSDDLDDEGIDQLIHALLGWVG